MINLTHPTADGWSGTRDANGESVRGAIQWKSCPQDSPVMTMLSKKPQGRCRPPSSVLRAEHQVRLGEGTTFQNERDVGCNAPRLGRMYARRDLN